MPQFTDEKSPPKTVLVCQYIPTTCSMASEVQLSDILRSKSMFSEGYWMMTKPVSLCCYCNYQWWWEPSRSCQTKNNSYLLATSLGQPSGPTTCRILVRDSRNQKQNCTLSGLDFDFDFEKCLYYSVKHKKATTEQKEIASSE